MLALKTTHETIKDYAASMSSKKRVDAIHATLVRRDISCYQATQTKFALFSKLLAWLYQSKGELVSGLLSAGITTVAKVRWYCYLRGGNTKMVSSDTVEAQRFRAL